MTRDPRCAVLFDLDGVIVDSSSAHRDSWMRLAAEAGLPFDEPTFRETFGLRTEDVLARLLGPCAPPGVVRRLGQRKEEIFRAIARGRLRVLPGARECVTLLCQARYRIGLASSAPLQNIAMILEDLGLAGQFEAIVSGEEVARGKPDPEIFLAVASRLGVVPGRCVVIEDAPAGIEAARRAGMAVVAVSPRGVTDTLLGADLIVRTLDELSADCLRALAAGIPRLQ